MEVHSTAESVALVWDNQRVEIWDGRRRVRLKTNQEPRCNWAVTKIVANEGAIAAILDNGGAIRSAAKLETSIIAGYRFVPVPLPFDIKNRGATTEWRTPIGRNQRTRLVPLSVTCQNMEDKPQSQKEMIEVEVGWLSGKCNLLEVHKNTSPRQLRKLLRQATSSPFLTLYGQEGDQLVILTQGASSIGSQCTR